MHRGMAHFVRNVRRTVDNSLKVVGIVYTRRGFVSPNAPGRSGMAVYWRLERVVSAFAGQWPQPGRTIRLAVGPGTVASYGACLGIGERSLELVVHGFGPALGVLGRRVFLQAPETLVIGAHP